MFTYTRERPTYTALCFEIQTMSSVGHAAEGHSRLKVNKAAGINVVMLFLNLLILCEFVKISGKEVHL